MRTWLTLAAMMSGMILSINTAQAYDFRPFEGDSRKAGVEDYKPKIDRKENKSNKFFSEQYSFDASPEDGYDFWFQIVISNMGVANGKAGLMVHYKPKGGKKIKAKASFDAGQWSYQVEGERLTLTLGENVFSGDGSNWKGHFVMEEFSADITISNQVPAWRPGGGTAWYGSGESSYYDVSLLCPRGTFEADVSPKGSDEKVHLTGRIYGDYSAMNIAPNLQARRWVKMRVVSRSYTLLLNTFESTEMYEQQWAGWFLIATDKGIVVTGLNPGMELSDLEVDTGSGYSVPKLVLFSGARETKDLKGVLKGVKRVAREDKLAELKGVERALVSKFVKPFGFKYSGEFEFAVDSGSGSKTYKGKGRYSYEQLLP